jgi:uncharacterized protein (DUF1800 family)
MKPYSSRRLLKRLALCCLSLVLVAGGPLASGAGISITATPGEPASIEANSAVLSAPFQTTSFADVPTTHPFYTEITNIAVRQITLGCGGGNYCPDASVTREQMAAFIIRALGDFNPPTPPTQRFLDVPPSNPFYAFIDELAALGITLGCGGGNYCPGASVTREQMAAFIIRAIGMPNPPTPGAQRFTDVPPSNPFYAFIEQMALRGVTAGCGVGIYCPANLVTRAQMAAFLVRGFGLTDPGAAGASWANASRFLEQASFGPTTGEIARVQSMGIRAYLDEQFALPISGYASMPLQPTTITPDCQNNIPPNCVRDNYSHYLLQRRLFERAMYQPDQLRQRVAWALHKIIVVSGRDLMQPSWMVPYLQILDSNAFGNYRQLLYQITLNPAMGRYLDMMTSTKNSPNENYPREVLQLFSVGTEKLNPDGTPILDINGVPLPTYDQSIVDGFTRVFTGWRLAPQPQPGVANYIDPMLLNGVIPEASSNHDFTSKTLLDGYTIPARTANVANAYQDLNDALDNIFNHPNVGPSIAKGLIHDLVTSNPSPAYVARVATKFQDNGSGTRGDLKSVVEAILLDPEARGDVKGDVNYGHLREPALYISNILRMFDAKSADRTQNSDGYLNPQSTNMDQDVLRPNTVFSYYPKDYGLPGMTNLVGPEFGILSTSSSLKRANFINTIVFSTIAVSGNAPNGTSIDLSGLQALAGNPSALVDEVNLLMMRSSMSTEMRTSIITAVTAVSSSNPLKRARTAVYLVATSSQYQVQR